MQEQTEEGDEVPEEGVKEEHPEEHPQKTMFASIATLCVVTGRETALTIQYLRVERSVKDSASIVASGATNEWTAQKTVSLCKEAVAAVEVTHVIDLHLQAIRGPVQGLLSAGVATIETAGNLALLSDARTKVTDETRSWKSPAARVARDAPEAAKKASVNDRESGATSAQSAPTPTKRQPGRAPRKPLDQLHRKTIKVSGRARTRARI